MIKNKYQTNYILADKAIEYSETESMFKFLLIEYKYSPFLSLIKNNKLKYKTVYLISIRVK
jgi:hypothetical protein